MAVAIPSVERSCFFRARVEGRLSLEGIDEDAAGLPGPEEAATVGILDSPAALARAAVLVFRGAISNSSSFLLFKKCSLKVLAAYHVLK